MGLRCFIGIAVAMLIPACAFADDDTGVGGGGWPHPPGGWLHPYVAADVGYNWHPPIDARSLAPAPDGRPYEWQFRLKSSWDLFVRAGYKLTPNLRAELEGDLREGDIQ